LLTHIRPLPWHRPEPPRLKTLPNLRCNGCPDTTCNGCHETKQRAVPLPMVTEALEECQSQILTRKKGGRGGRREEGTADASPAGRDQRDTGCCMGTSLRWQGQSRAPESVPPGGSLGGWDLIIYVLEASGGHGVPCPYRSLQKPPDP
jgi:hypothetical protein